MRFDLLANEKQRGAKERAGREEVMEEKKILAESDEIRIYHYSWYITFDTT